MKSIWKEIKEAFPFWFCKRSGKAIFYPWDLPNMMFRPISTYEHFHQTSALIKWSILYGKKRFPFEPNWLLRKRLLNAIKPSPPNHDPIHHCGRQWPEPPSLKPFIIALLVLAGLLILHGLACEFGLVNYAPILK